MLLFEAISNFIFPQSCGFCGNIIPSSQAICRDCFKSLKWFDSTTCCLKCSSETDIEEKICLSCKRGFFYPKKVLIILNRSLPFSIIDSYSKQKFVLSLFTLFLNELKISNNYTGVDFINSKLFSNNKYKKEYENILGIPCSKKDKEKKHLLLIGMNFINKLHLNQITLNFFKKGYENVSFIFFH